MKKSNNMRSPCPLTVRRPCRKPDNRLPLQKKIYVITQNTDRHIANRGSTDLDMARHILTKKEKNENDNDDTPSKEIYKRELAAILFNGDNVVGNKAKILSFKEKKVHPKENLQWLFDGNSSVEGRPKLNGHKRCIPQSAERTLDAPDLVDDYYLNVLDWSASNILSIALDSSVYCWDESTSSTSELMTVDDDVGPITSISWAPDAKHIGVGLSNSLVQIWDSANSRQIRSLRGHYGRVGSLSWSGHILTTGGMDGLIINHDVRIRQSVVQTYRGHREEVCGLKWSLSGEQLASGGNDNFVHIWDRHMSSSNGATQYLHRMEKHSAAVKALSWCPFQPKLLASGGGIGDHHIMFWNTNTGACLKSIDTKSQVSALLWNKHEREILSSHGHNDNQLTLWKYPSMVKITELRGHTSRVLHLAQSPNGDTVASAAADETLRFWKVFGSQTSKRLKDPESRSLFSNLLTRIR